jgi:hypothetical protein
MNYYGEKFPFVRELPYPNHAQMRTLVPPGFLGVERAAVFIPRPHRLESLCYQTALLPNKLSLTLPGSPTPSFMVKKEIPAGNARPTFYGQDINKIPAPSLWWAEPTLQIAPAQVKNLCHLGMIKFLSQKLCPSLQGFTLYRVPRGWCAPGLWAHSGAGATSAGRLPPRCSHHLRHSGRCLPGPAGLLRPRSDNPKNPLLF